MKRKGMCREKERAAGSAARGRRDEEEKKRGETDSDYR